VDQFEVPDIFKQAGYTPQTIENQVVDQVVNIENHATTLKETFALPDSDSMPDIEVRAIAGVPGTAPVPGKDANPSVEQPRATAINILGKSDIRYNAGTEETINVIINAGSVPRTSEYERMVADLQHYLYTAVRRRAMSQFRRAAVRRRAIPLLALEGAADAPADADFEAEELRQRLERALSALPPRTRAAFVLSRNEGLSYAEVASRMAISPKTIGVHISRALTVLRKALLPS